MNPVAMPVDGRGGGVCPPFPPVATLLVFARLFSDTSVQDVLNSATIWQCSSQMSDLHALWTTVYAVVPSIYNLWRSATIRNCQSTLHRPFDALHPYPADRSAAPRTLRGAGTDVCPLSVYRSCKRGAMVWNSLGAVTSPTSRAPLRQLAVSVICETEWIWRLNCAVQQTAAQRNSASYRITSRPVFTALHVMQTRYSEENSVCLSVCPSVPPSHAWSLTKRKKDLSRFLYHTKEHLS